MKSCCLSNFSIQIALDCILDCLEYLNFQNSSAPKDLSNKFSILKKCKSKFDCLVFEMFFINKLIPSLSVQSDSIRAKVFK